MKQTQIQNLKEKKKLLVTILFVLLFFVISPGIVNASIQDLIASYNFDFSLNGEVAVNNQTDFMKDLDSDSVNDTLFFNLSLDVGINGTYTFFVDLNDQNGIVVAERTETVNSNTESISLNMSTELLTNSQFNYSIRVYNGSGVLVYRKYKQLTNIYPNYEAGFEVISTSDQNMGNNLIRISLEINSTKSETQNVTVFLGYGDSSIQSTKEVTFSVGQNNVSLDFDNETIKSTHYNGSYIIDTLNIGDKVIDLNDTTAVYDFEDFSKTSYFKSYSDFEIDSDANNLTDFLQINYTIEVKQTRNYSIESKIFDEFDNFVVSVSKTEYLSVGTNVVEILINGSNIYNSKIDGPYIIKLATLKNDSDSLIDEVIEPYNLTTPNLTYYDFERPPLPDLNISMNVYYNGSDNLVNVTIGNIGTATAFNVFVDVFDNNTYEGQDSIALLNVSDSHLFSFVANGTLNNSIFVAIVDFDNLVDESNESNNVVSNAVAPNITSFIDFNESNIVDGGINQGENVSFNVTVTDDNFDVESVWLKIWQGAIGISVVIWQGFLSFVSGDLWTTSVETNESFNLGENNYTVYANDSVGNEVSQNGSFNVVIPNDTSKFIHKNSLGETVAWFGTQGNVVIEGSKFVGGCSAPGSDSLIIKNSSYNINAFINSTGDLCVKSFVEGQESCNPDADAFRIRNLSYYNVSYIDVEGDMCLTGGLYEGVEL